jgi:5'-nucleotidase
MDILLTNDDGIHAQSLWTLEKALSNQHNVFVVAPDAERSAAGHSITLTSPLRLNTVHVNGRWGYAVNGTPADCVKLAVLEILERRPDLVISGINPGPNVGINLNYSGTVSAAKEATLMGIAAVAVSQDPPADNDYGPTACFVGTLITKIVQEGLPAGTFLNVNVPGCPLQEIGGICITKQGLSPVAEAFHKRIDPRKQNYYWQGMETQVFDQETDSDGAALRRKCISITPVHCDMTDYKTMERLKRWNIQLT